MCAWGVYKGRRLSSDDGRRFQGPSPSALRRNAGFNDEFWHEIRVFVDGFERGFDSGQEKTIEYFMRGGYDNFLDNYVQMYEQLDENELINPNKLVLFARAAIVFSIIDCLQNGRVLTQCNYKSTHVAFAFIMLLIARMKGVPENDLYSHLFRIKELFQNEYDFAVFLQQTTQSFEEFCKNNPDDIFNLIKNSDKI